MSVLRRFGIGGLFGLAFAIVCGGAPATEPTTFQTALKPIAQLAPGKTPGTIHLVYRGRAEFSMPGHSALSIAISERFQPDIAALRLNDAGAFVVETDIRPGSYSVVVSAADAENADYRPSASQTIHIDKAGRLYQPHDWFSEPGVFVLERRMKEVSPVNLAIADARAPLLKWPAIAGATHYVGNYYGSDQMKWFNVEETQYRMGSGLNAGDWCGWSVSAVDGAGKVLARGEGGFFGLGTDDATIAQARAGGGTCGVPPPAGRPYLGIDPLPTQAPKNPKTPMEYGKSGSYAIRDRESGFIPGIEINRVFAGSPAVDADLHPDDVIVALDGQPVPSESSQGDVRTFVALTSAMEPGRKITLTVRRFPQELTLIATIGRYPGAGGAATQPASQPAPGQPAAAADMRKNGDVVDAHGTWTDVEPGTPAKHAFQAKPGADIPVLSVNEGLASNMVNCMAELPHGEIAFGTREGLSIWDGAEIRTYTGPSFSSTRGGMVNGNSGLPANEIQDMHFDSRGRLWVATLYGLCRIDAAPGGAWRALGNSHRNAFARRGLDMTLDIQTIFEASDGTIILGGRGAAITLIDPKTDTPKVIHDDGEMNHWITGIAEDAKHRLWFSVMGFGVLRYDGAKVEEIHGKWIPGTGLRGLCIDGAGTVWVADGEKGLGALHADGAVEVASCDQLAGGNIFSLSLDRTKHVFALSEGGLSMRASGVAPNGNSGWRFAGRIDPFSWYAHNSSDGSWWMTDMGISRFSKLDWSAIRPREAAIERFKHETEKAFPKIKANRMMAIDADGAVTAAIGEKLLRFDGKKWEDIGARFEKLSVSRIKADSKGTIWIATSGQGLIGLDPTGGVRRFNHDASMALSVIYDMDEAADGTLYVGTQYGLYRVRGAACDKIETNQPVDQVGQVLVDRHGRVWLMEVTYHKIFVYDGKRFRDVKDQSVLSGDELQWGSLRLDADGNVLVDVPPRPAAGLAQRTFRWNAAAEGKIGDAVEVK